MTEELTQLESPPENTDASSDEQPGTAQPEEQTGNAEPEKDGAQDEQAEEDELKDPETVPYSRFKEVYGALKRTERELDATKQGKPESGKVAEQIQSTTPKPKAENFEDYDSYIEALTDWKLEQADVKRQQGARQQEQEQSKQKWDSQVADAMAKDPKFLERGYIPHGLVPVLEGTDRLVEFAYYFGENPGEAQRILSLPAIAQAKEIGKLEAGFTKTGPQRRTTTKAPEPTKPVGGKETASTGAPPDDMSEYVSWRKAGGGSR